MDMKINSVPQNALPKTNLILLTLFSFISGGIYLPIWYLRRRSFFQYDLSSNPFLSKWFFIGAILALLGLVILGVWFGVSLELIKDTTRQLSLEKIKAGEDILSIFKDNPGLLDSRLGLEKNLYYLQIGYSIVGLFLFIQSLTARLAINVYLKGSNQKPIALWLWLILAGGFYLLFFQVGNGFGLLWANFPLIFLMQYRINRLKSERADPTVASNVHKVDGGERPSFVFNKPKLFLTLLIVIIIASGIGGWFYWSQWRPSEIRKGCYRELTSWTRGNFDQSPEWFVELIPQEDNRYIRAFSPEDFILDDRIKQLSKEEEDEVYKDCLRSQGLDD